MSHPTALPQTAAASPPVLRHGKRWAAWLERHLWLLIPLLALPALLPFVTVGLPRSFDGRTHLLRIAALDRALQAGDLLPRWSPTMQVGYGYPVFNFYAPAAYYLAVGFHRLGASYYWAYIAALMVPVLVAGFGMYVLARDVFGARTWPALAAAVAYMYSPYLLVNIYVRGSVAEALAQALLPWMLWSFRRLWFAGGRSEQGSLRTPWMVAAAFSLALLAVAHSLTLFYAVVFLMGYLAVLWVQQRSRSAMYAALLALAFAAGISAFCWLPVLAERSYLGSEAYATARNGWLPGNVWDWTNFVDWSALYRYSFVRPVALGLVQVILGAAGFVVARRRDAEWLYLGAAALIGCLLVGRWALPLWTSTDLLAATQFPWRLLSIVSLPLALFAGGLLTRVEGGWQQFAATAVLIALVIVAQAPRIDQLPVFAQAGMSLSDAVLVQSEVEKGVLDQEDASSSVEEFRPKWATETVLKEQPAQASSAPGITLAQANSLDLTFAYTSTAPTVLRFEDYYYPGWQVLVDGVAQPTSPSTSLGLLTMNLAAGAHQVVKRWAGTPISPAATGISLLTLSVLAVLVWLDRRWRWLAVLPAVLAVLGLAAYLWPRPLQPVAQPQNAVAGQGVALLGWRVADAGSEDGVIHTWWRVDAPPPGDLRLHWQVLDQAGKVVGEARGMPYFNALSADNWARGAIVDDAAQLPTPAGLPAGRYQLALGLGAAAPQVIGEFEVAQALPGGPKPRYPAAATFGDVATLAGIDVNAPVVAASLAQAGSLPVVRAGHPLDVTAYWQPVQAPALNYHGFVHLIDAAGNPIAKADQLPGPDLSPPAGWLPGRTYPDVYRLQLPADAPGGLYTPLVGLYAVGSVGEFEPARLAPLKLVGDVGCTPSQSLAVDFGPNIRLTGVDVAPAQPALRAGDTLTVTLCYRSAGPTQADLTRFLQVHDAANGMAAQFDSPPQAGQNPTWTWQPGEIVRDTVALQMAPDARPGRYQLLTGFYDAKAGGARTLATDASGKRLPDDAAVLGEVEIVR